VTWDGQRLAVTLLSVIPVPAGRATRSDAGATIRRDTAAAAMAWAPAVGLLLGGAAAAVLAAAWPLLHAGPLLAAALAVATLALLTRGLHLDGLADLADGLGGGRTATAALAIMKRSDIGPFGTVTLVLTLLIQVAALAQAQARGHGAAAIIGAAVTGRLALCWACRRGIPAARADGLGALVAGTVASWVPPVLTTVVLGAAAACGALLPGSTGGWPLPAAVATGLAASLVLARHAVRRLGGITGDVLGALVEVGTLACLVVVAR
jgi:adenosylcobinamide-GDP ribazoletransferase